MYYYKDHSADWWRKNGRAGYIASSVLSAGAALLLFQTQFESFQRLVAKVELTIMCIFLAFGTVIGQMIMQRMCRNYLRNALFAEQSEIGADRGELAKYDAVLFWVWTADLAVFMVVYGLAFANEVIYAACGLPAIGMLFIIMLIKASMATTHAKKMEQIYSEGKTDDTRGRV